MDKETTTMFSASSVVVVTSGQRDGVTKTAALNNS